MTASNVAALPTGKGQFSLTPQSLDEALRFADMLSKSSIVPKDYQGNPGNVIVAIQWGAELGLAPLQAMQSVAVINGRPSIWGRRGARAGARIRPARLDRRDARR